MKRSSSCRQRKVQCPECGNVARQTRSWMQAGLLVCPCGHQLEPTELADRAFVGMLDCEDVPATVWTAICRQNGWEDSIIRRGAAAKAWEKSDASKLEQRKTGAAHCVFAGCGRWVAAGADRCTAGHAQHDHAPEVAAIPF